MQGGKKRSRCLDCSTDSPSQANVCNNWVMLPASCWQECVSGMGGFAHRRGGVGVGRKDTMAQTFLANPRAVRGSLLKAHRVVATRTITITDIRCLGVSRFIVERFCHDCLLAPTQVC